MPLRKKKPEPTVRSRSMHSTLYPSPFRWAITCSHPTPLFHIFAMLVDCTAMQT